LGPIFGERRSSLLNAESEPNGPYPILDNASLAQSGEHFTVTEEVRGSKPLRGAKIYGVDSLMIEPRVVIPSDVGLSPIRHPKSYEAKLIGMSAAIVDSKWRYRLGEELR
jgi:hypothetical protein